MGDSHYISGYPSLAAFIASDKDKSTLIFKRFDRLAARNLLHLQSELARLQSKVDLLDEEDAEQNEGDPDKAMQNKQYLRSWDEFISAKEDDPRQKERFELAERIKRALKDYREALIFESTLASLPQPTNKTFHAFRLKFFNRTKEDPDGFPTLGGSSFDVYDNRDDLASLKVPEHPDRLTEFAQDHLAFLFETGPRDGQIGYASDIHIVRFVALLSIFLAALLLIGAIVGLYVVQSPQKRLGMIATFTVIFATGVGLLTNARRPELFAATAAYAAVLVVFVSGNLGGSACPKPNG